MSTQGPKGGNRRGRGGGSGGRGGDTRGRGRGSGKAINRATGRSNTGANKGFSKARGEGQNRQPSYQQRRRSHTAGLGGDRVEGRQAVRELLLAGIRPVREVNIVAGQNQAGGLAQVVELAAELRVPIKELARTKFESLAVTESPQGVIAFAAPLVEHDLEELLRPTDSGPAFLLVLDGVTDPGNVGAALRTAECAGVTGAVLGRHRAAHITPAAAKAAAGAIEHVPMALVPGIPNALARLKELGVWTVGLDVVAPTTIYDVSVASEAVALVVGSEGRGLSRLARQRCDLVVTIPVSGHLSSLNAAAAVAIGCFEIARHR
ncbi:MAG: 23S rRNA (guanosine(2251)-2'-O)-methyltransferase RlmB [bacterium]|nr:23S rRNA (guanosine(2251)-2'-O)-methyltransferase RlmB [bacterium]